MGRRAAVLLLLWAGAAPLAAQEAPPAEVWLHRPLIAVMQAPETRLAPFTTDGCSGGMSGIWASVAAIAPEFERQSGARPPWEPCCVTHDRAYHNAGGATTAEASAAARLDADRALQACVAGWAARDTSLLIETYGLTEAQLALNYGVLAQAMYQAVRLGGAPCSGLPWRWGYGYPQCSPLD